MSGSPARHTFDLRLVAPFTVLSEELHFGHAAQVLGIALPALSQQISRLERQLGVSLLVRSGRQVTLTPAGRRFLTEGREILRLASRAQAALVRGTDLRVHLGSEPSPVVGRLVSSFSAAHGYVDLHLSDGSANDSMRAVQEQSADVGFNHPEGVPAALSILVMDRAPIGLVVPAEHPLAQHPTVAWTELDAETLFLAPPGIADGWNKVMGRALGRTDAHPARFVGPRVTRASYLVQTIESGVAVMTCAEDAINPLPAGLVWRLLTPEQTIETALVWDDSSSSQALREFVSWARHTTSALPGIAQDR